MKGHRVTSSRLHNLTLALTALGLFVALARPVEAGEQCGLASWYGYESGATTASGERFEPDGISAAHKTLPFGTIVTVRWGERTIQVRINDRGPFIAGRVIDLSRGAARALGMLAAGVVPVCLVWSE